jgi:type II secretory ATPase GspE/PulE/Tfp pilus assembly ATPase PilB-like protein
VHEIRSDDANLITVEDPVEYELAGINQVQINEKAGLTFPFILRAILRQDPDVIMIGEIRDFETAEIAVQASLTGHLVLSTLHTNDAPSAITRLLDIGIPPYMITSTVVGVVAQRLLRKICPDCKEPYTPDQEMFSLLNVSHQDVPSSFYRGTGCAQCNNTGFKGRTVIEEIMTMGHKVRDLVLSAAGADSVREAAMASGMTTLAHNGLEKIRSGVTTVEEVVRQAYQAEE